MTRSIGPYCQFLLYVFCVFGTQILHAQSYCTPNNSTGCSFGDDIDDVIIGTFQDLNTGCSSNNYANKISDTIFIQQATTTSVSFTSNFSYQYFAIWVDFNGDGDFSDSGEHLWSSPTNVWSSTTGSITVPSTVSSGSYRLRVRSNYSAVITASQSCSSFTYGETHDYTVGIGLSSGSNGGGTGQTTIPCSDLFFSEYNEGPGGNYLEVYNPTNNTIPLSNYSIYTYKLHYSSYGNPTVYSFTSNDSIESGDVFVIASNQIYDTITRSRADTLLGGVSIMNYSGEKSIILCNGNDTIDVIGIVGACCLGISSTSDFTSNNVLSNGAINYVTLVRHDSVSNGSTDWSTGNTEWFVYPPNTRRPGSHSSSCIVSNVDVTFRLDMNDVNFNFSNVYVSGSFNNWSLTANELTDLDGDGEFESEIPLMPGSYTYKFIYDGISETLDPTLDSACVVTTSATSNRHITVPNTSTILPLVCWEKCFSCNGSNIKAPCFDFKIGSSTSTSDNVRLGASVATSDDGSRIVVSEPLRQYFSTSGGGGNKYGRVYGFGVGYSSTSPLPYLYGSWRNTNNIEFDGLWQIALSGDGSTLALASPTDDGKPPGVSNNVLRGRVRIFTPHTSINQWTLIGDIVGEADYDQSGTSISLSQDGTIIAIGSKQNDGGGSNSGHVRVYEYANSTWTQLGSDIDGEAVGDNAGFSVALSDDGNVVAFGAPYNDGNGFSSGHVRVYEYANGTWTQLGSDIDGEAAGDQAGYSISLSNDGYVLAIGAPYNDGNGFNSGHVRVYEYANSTWTQLGTDIDGEAGGDQAGYSISLSNDGNTIAIGAPYHAGKGQVRVFELTNNSWSQGGIDTLNSACSNRFGDAVALSGDASTLVVGSQWHDIAPSSSAWNSGQNVGLVEVFYDSYTPSYSNGTGIFCSGDSIGLSVLDIPGRTYSWSTGDTSNAITVYQGGNYHLVISSSYGIVDTVHFQTTELVAPNTTITNSGPINFCNNDSVILSSASGQSYLWNTGDTTQSISVSQAGVYYALVTANNGCSDTTTKITTSLFPDPNLNISTSGSLGFCPGDSVTLSGVTGQTYVWNTGDTTQSISITQSGTYYALVTTNYGCFDSTSQYQTLVYPSPDTSVYLSGPLTFCESNPLTLGAAQGHTYLWNTGASTRFISTSQSGSYYAVVTTSLGCSDTTATYTTTLLPNPDTSIALSGSLDFCPTDSVTLTAQAGLEYLWNTGDTNQSVTVSQSGSYFATITNSLGCSATTATYTTNVLSAPDTLVTTSGSLNLCSGQSVTLTAAPGYTYLWNTGATNQSITTNSSGVYYAIVTTNDGCIDTTNSNTVTVSSIPTPNINASQLKLCPGQMVTLSTSNTYSSYAWGGDTIGTLDSITVTAGHYWLSVTNNSGCSGSDTIQIGEIVPYTTQPEICIVTNDSATGFNKIIWERNSKLGVEYYNIYRDDVIGYTKIGSKGVNQLSQLLDNTANPGLRSYKYYLTITDSCGIEHGSTVTEHSTIHLQSNLGTNGEVNLLWNSYTGRTPLYYRIYRKASSASIFAVIDSVNLTSNTYTDFNTITGFTTYQVAAVMGSGCNSSNKTGVTTSLSNSSTQNTISINENVFKSVKILPNPNRGVFSVSFSQETDRVTYTIINSTGQIISNGVIKNKIHPIDLSNQPTGVYMFRISIGNIIESFKVIVQ